MRKAGVDLVRWAAMAVLCAFPSLGCEEHERDVAEVVVFVALDREYSEPILERFEAETGVAVRPVYDAEAAKTTGLVNRILSRADDPDGAECDVWWSNEAAQTAALAERGVLEAYASPNAARIPAEHRDPQGRWTGFAARFRVLAYNPDLVREADLPRRLEELTEPRWRGRFAVATPYFGTTFTHMMLLRQRWGEAKLEAWLRDLKENGAIFAPGNGPVRDLVAAGEVAIGLTDSDDAHGAMLDGKSLAVALIDFGDGLVLIPNTVALVKGSTQPAHARRLIDHLLSADVERSLAAARSAQLPLGSDLIDLPTPWTAITAGMAPSKLDLADADRQREALVDLLRRAGVER